MISFKLKLTHAIGGGEVRGKGRGKRGTGGGGGNKRQVPKGFRNEKVSVRN